MIKKIIDFLKNREKTAILAGTLFYAGYFPVAPGTFGSLISLPVIFIVCYFFGTLGLLTIIILSFIVSIISVKEILLHTEHDPSFVVIDEFVGQSVTFLTVAELLKRNADYWWVYIIGFLLFRLFDVTKPFPVSYADKKINNALGVVLDDILAGAYASVCLYVVVLLLK
ncbi:MAG: phosphatidylglycerophosphatase A [Endomicrobiaceae bacterium]|jgi:phosphatidylglycerophosphatase A|nr:phosphatidylglycerophosphatase A [Endomicrobiaceae bacterium]